MKLTLTKFNVTPGTYGSKLELSHIKLTDDYGKYIKFLSVEEALPYLQDHTFHIPDIEKYSNKPSYFDNVTKGKLYIRTETDDEVNIKLV